MPAVFIDVQVPVFAKPVFLFPAKMLAPFGFDSSTIPS
jgi:hypothetical protein